MKTRPQEPALFDTRTLDKKCRACGQRDPRACQYDYEKRNGYRGKGFRPKSCLATGQGKDIGF